MLHPTIDELTRGKYNRYELALATAKCARIVTDEYVKQHEIAEKSQTGNKETDKPINQLIDRELRDEKAVHVAVGRLYRGDYVIDPHAREHEAEAIAKAEAEAAERAERAAQAARESAEAILAAEEAEARFAEQKKKQAEEAETEEDEEDTVGSEDTEA